MQRRHVREVHGREVRDAGTQLEVAGRHREEGGGSGQRRDEGDEAGGRQFRKGVTGVGAARLFVFAEDRERVGILSQTEAAVGDAVEGDVDGRDLGDRVVGRGHELLLLRLERALGVDGGHEAEGLAFDELIGGARLAVSG